MHRLVVADAALRGRPGRWQIGIDGGRITAVGQERLSGEYEIDAAGGLVAESFVDAHLHLDKVHTLDRAGDAANRGLRALVADGLGAGRHQPDSPA